MESAKIISNKKYSEIFLIMGTIVLVLGVILKFVMDRAVFYDLPIYIICVGIALLIYGAKKFLDKKNHGVEVEISVKTAKNFLTNNNEEE